MLNLDKSKKYIIVGFPKCGQNSLQIYLQKLGYDVERRDIIWRSNAAEKIQQSHPDRIPIIVTRDPVEMIWSSYWYWAYKDIMSIPQYLRYRTDVESTLGFENPAEHADYEKHIHKFVEYEPIVLKFEDLVKLDGFPHENKTWEKPGITPHYREMILGAIERYKP